jgi:hypothetical protein
MIPVGFPCDLLSMEVLPTPRHQSAIGQRHSTRQ